MVDLIFYLYGFVLIVFIVELAGMVLFSLIKKIFKATDEAKKELEKVATIEE